MRQTKPHNQSNIQQQRTSTTTRERQQKLFCGGWLGLLTTKTTTKRPKATAQGGRKRDKAKPCTRSRSFCFIYQNDKTKHERPRKTAHKARNKATQEKHQAKPQTSHTGQITSPQGQQRGKE